MNLRFPLSKRLREFALGISVVAEGIENLEMLDLVRQLEVQCVQGCLLGRPSEMIPEASTLQDLSPFLYSGSR